MPVAPASVLPSFDPVHLGQRLRRVREQQSKDSEERPFVTFLIGAGFSRSAGIPVASEIVGELSKEIADEPLFQARYDALEEKQISAYARSMEALGTPMERARRIRNYVDRARLRPGGPLKINWAHLLLAALAKHNYVTRILTTNFDPLVVEALAFTGQPVRTFDLNIAGHYDSDILEEGTVVYLHGQMHSLLLANVDTETQNIQQHYRAVLQEAIRNSFLIVVGYSGECDPVLESLKGLITLPRGLWWSHYGAGSPGDGAKALFARHANACFLAAGDDADLFMRKLVLEGMKLPMPGEITGPFAAMDSALARIAPTLPPLGSADTSVQDADPVASARALLQAAQQKTPPPAIQPAPGFPVSATSDIATPALQDLQLKVLLDEASVSGNWPEFEKLSAQVLANPASSASRAVGDGLLRRSGSDLDAHQVESALSHLCRIADYGVSEKLAVWVPVLRGNAFSEQARVTSDTTDADRLFTNACSNYAEAVRIKSDMHEALYNWGTILSDQAKLKGNSPDADRLFADSYSKFAEAVRIKPDKHAAFYNWGTALSDQAKLKGDSPDADRLFADSYSRFAEALRIKPDEHEAFLNWGTALANQAKSKGDSPDADRLFADSYSKFAEAVRIKPDKHAAFFNWGTVLYYQAKLKGSPDADRLFADSCSKFTEAVCIKPDKPNAWFFLACIHALQDQSQACLDALKQWQTYSPNAARIALDHDSDFDRVRDLPEFRTFRESLPE